MDAPEPTPCPAPCTRRRGAAVRGDGLGKEADVGIHRRGLHGGKLVDVFSGGRPAEHEWPTTEVVAAYGLVP